MARHYLVCSMNLGGETEHHGIYSDMPITERRLEALIASGDIVPAYENAYIEVWDGPNLLETHQWPIGALSRE